MLSASFQHGLFKIHSFNRPTQWTCAPNDITMNLQINLNFCKLHHSNQLGVCVQYRLDIATQRYRAWTVQLRCMHRPPNVAAWLQLGCSLRTRTVMHRWCNQAATKLQPSCNVDATWMQRGCIADATLVHRARFAAHFQWCNFNATLMHPGSL